MTTREVIKNPNGTLNTVSNCHATEATIYINVKIAAPPLMP
jgi:hypothetical protein